MRLESISADEAEALSRGETTSRPTAPGWPHDHTAAGLSFARNGGWQYLVIDDEGRVAGDCGTKSLPQDGVVEIGYGLAAASRGHGLGSAAVAELVEQLRVRPGVTAIEAEVDVANPASWRILERLGFVAQGQPVEGYLRYRLTT